MSTGLKPGYKQTEVGVIPKDWDVREIREVCTVINGRGFKPHEWGTSGLPIIRIQNLNGSEEFNYYSGDYNPKIIVDNGQLLFAWSGSRGTSFGPHVWHGGRALLNYHTWKMVQDESKVITPYLFHALRNLTSHIENRAHGASALVHTQKWEMEQFHVLVPPLPEQRAIAAALSDVDSLIASLDKLIAKKRDIKQGAMQQLLRGKRRLAGFAQKTGVKQTEVGVIPEQWNSKFLHEVCWSQEGPGLRQWQFTTAGMKVINVTNLEKGFLNLERTERHISIDEFNRTYSHFLIDAGDIVVASSGNSYCKVAVVREQDLPLVMNTSVIECRDFLSEGSITKTEG